MYILALEGRMNPQIFREYDIRGLVDKDLTELVVEKVGRGLGTLVRRDGGRWIVVGATAENHRPGFARRCVRE